jgi:acyl carrier protein
LGTFGRKNPRRPVSGAATILLQLRGAVMMQVRSNVEATIREVAAEHHKSLPQLTDDLPLLESGLDSLCLAVVVARLEDGLGVDPFSAEEGVALPVTIGDFVKLYEDATR